MSDKRVARGVYRTDSGWRIYVRVDGKLAAKRLPASMSLGEVKRWREDHRTDLRREPPRDETAADSVPGAFAADAERYLKAVKAMPTWKERARHIRLWVALLGADRRRSGITPTEIRAVRDRWLTEGPRLVYRKKTTDQAAHYEEVSAPLSASQVNNRLRALENLWTVLDGRHAPNPVREVPEADEGDREPRALPWAVVDAILNAMPDRGRGDRHSDGSQTKARLLVMKWTGLSHAHLRQLERRDVDVKASTLFLRRRRKGRADQKKGCVIPLLPEAVDAFKHFDDLECWGAFSHSSMWKSFQRAAKEAGFTGLRPYDLRHTFATHTAQAVDPDLAQQLLGHASAATTAHYTAAAVNPRIAAAFKKLRGKIGRDVTPKGNSRRRNGSKSTRSSRRTPAF